MKKWMHELPLLLVEPGCHSTVSCLRTCVNDKYTKQQPNALSVMCHVEYVLNNGRLVLQADVSKSHTRTKIVSLVTES